MTNLSNLEKHKNHVSNFNYLKGQQREKMSKPGIEYFPLLCVGKAITETQGGIFWGLVQI